MSKHTTSGKTYANQQKDCSPGRLTVGAAIARYLEHMAAACYAERTMQAILGHAKMDTTARYWRLFPEDMQEAVRLHPLALAGDVE